MENDLAKHMMIEFFNHNGRFGKFDGFYLDENPFDMSSVYEKYGVFDECLEISRNIINLIKGNQSEENATYELKPNSLTKKIYVSFEHIPDTIAGYRYKDSIYNKTEKMFERITLVVSYPEKTGLSSVMHEIQHAKEDLELRKKGKTIEDILTYYGYGKNVTYRNNGELEKAISHILYYLTSFERNAFINSIYAEMKTNKSGFGTVADAVKFIKDTEFYKSYENVLYNCGYFINLNDEKKKTAVLNYVNSKSNLYFGSYHKFRNWLKSKITEYRKKFNTIIPKMAYTCFENSMAKFASVPCGLEPKVKRIDEFMK